MLSGVALVFMGNDSKKLMMLIHLPPICIPRRTFFVRLVFQKNVQQFRLNFSCHPQMLQPYLIVFINFFILKGCLFKATGGQCKKGNFGESTTFGWCGKWFGSFTTFFKSWEKITCQNWGTMQMVLFSKSFPISTSKFFPSKNLRNPSSRSISSLKIGNSQSHKKSALPFRVVVKLKTSLLFR